MRVSEVLSLSVLVLRHAVASRAVTPDIRADTNRDGIVDLTGDTDILGKTNWTEAFGAIFLPNIGDTDRRCSMLALSGPALSNDALDDCNDASDDIQRAPQFLAPLKTVPIAGLSKSAIGSVSVADPVARDLVRIFRKDGNTWAITGNNYTFNAEALQSGLNLGIDGRDVRRPDGWDGKVTVRFTVRDGNTTSSDDVALRVAPVLTHHHLQTVEKVLAVQGNKIDDPGLLRFTEDLSTIVKEAGIHSQVYLFNHSNDIWAQDFVEPGYANMPGPNGTISIRVMIRCPQDDRVAGRQLFEYYREAGVGAVQHLGGAPEEINSGGNIETIPPFTFNGKTWPAGRVILGNHKTQKHHIYPFLQAQETQEPVLLDTDWLGVGHVDEFLQFLPANNERGWVLMADDPRAGMKMLKDIQTAGHGSTPAISRKNDSESNYPIYSPTVDEALADVNLLSTNEECSKRIDANLEILKRETGLEDAEILRIPALFEADPFGNENSPLRVSACFPAAINSLVLSGFKTSVAPNPFGPVVDGRDVLSEAVTNEYSKIGMNVTFIDDWYTHHSFGGEVHSGTNTIRDMSAQWW
ncbi:hypothetical protein N8I77_012097 [Diaporthe amygdali]|uniref:Protein-arginine deiminase C-terminal domain-containing protein n=1 Tax=Phomopsis amygdali TaxID=1214568 RepID=A0AAD9S508_PHOAM|nr:hypothetical protein N8I77_012097 [Diaporthe amygdali]